MWGLVGQERAVRAIAAGLRSPRPPHAFLFAGPANVGKHTLALRVAQALNCEAAPEARPCHECNQCRRIEAGVHADVQTVTVEAGEGGPHKEILIAQIREVERAVALKPYEGRTRAVIIDPAEAMNAEAQNAFLKTLEEPPPDIVFLLVTVAEERLLPTIRSRCQRVELGLLAIRQVEEELGKRGVAADRAALLARLSRGRVGLALAMAEDESLLEEREEALRAMRELLGQGLAQRFDLAERMAGRFAGDRQGVLARLELWRDWWRDVLLAQGGNGEQAVNADKTAELRESASRYPMAEVVSFLRALEPCRRYLEANVNPRLALEALLLELPAGERLPAGKK